MKFTQVLILCTLAVANASPFNLRRREQSAACTSAELLDFPCGLPDNTVGAIVCREGFTACINPGDHEADDTCGPCPKISIAEDPRVEVPSVVLPLCSEVDVADFACPLPDGSIGALTCESGFTACVDLDSIGNDDTCGCCAGDDSPRCQEVEMDGRTMGSVKATPICSATELVANACDIAGEPVGATVCRHGFTACINTKALHAQDTCGACAPVETPEEARVEVPKVSLPVCAEVDLADFACVLTDGSTGALVCNKGFTACLPTADIEDDFSCGCCSGDESARCQKIEEPRLVGLDAVSEASLACSALELEANPCSITVDGPVGATVCRNGFTACIQAGAHLETDTCGPCPTIVAPEEPRGDESNMMAAELAALKCTKETIADFDCILPDKSVGVYTCKFGFTSCVAIGTLTESSACGCCPGDELDGCMSTKYSIPSLSARNADFDFP